MSAVLPYLAPTRRANVELPSSRTTSAHALVQVKPDAEVLVVGMNDGASVSLPLTYILWSPGPSIRELLTPSPPCGTARSARRAACRTRRRSPWCSSSSDAAQKSWRRLDGHNQLPKLIQGVRFTDGIEVAANPASSQSQTAAA